MDCNKLAFKKTVLKYKEIPREFYNRKTIRPALDSVFVKIRNIDDPNLMRFIPCNINEAHLFNSFKEADSFNKNNEFVICEITIYLEECIEKIDPDKNTFSMVFFGLDSAIAAKRIFLLHDSLAKVSIENLNGVSHYEILTIKTTISKDDMEKILSNDTSFNPAKETMEMTTKDKNIHINERFYSS